ncbi:MAG TPA: MFS transporter [Solirubrobacteraceae bacterium]|nr:MFS transporter [Solirubrobacteraceae bacterium]
MSGALERVRRLCLSLPEVTERPSHGSPTWFVRDRRRRITGAEGLVFAATLVLLAVSGGLFLALLAMFWTGVAWEAAFVQKLTWIQYDSPPGMKGRMLGLFFAGYLAALSIGALVIGAAFDAVGIKDSLLICAGCVAAFALWSIWDAKHPITEPPERAPNGS